MTIAANEFLYDQKMVNELLKNYEKIEEQEIAEIINCLYPVNAFSDESISDKISNEKNKNFSLENNENSKKEEEIFCMKYDQRQKYSLLILNTKSGINVANFLKYKLLTKRNNSIVFEGNQEDYFSGLPIQYLTFDYLGTFIKEDYSFIQQKKLCENINSLFQKKLNLVPFSNEFNAKEFKLIKNNNCDDLEEILENLLHENYSENFDYKLNIKEEIKNKSRFNNLIRSDI